MKKNLITTAWSGSLMAPAHAGRYLPLPKMGGKETAMKSTSKMFKALFFWGGILLLFFALVGQAAAQICVEPPAGLVSWWPGDGNADDIVNGNEGTLQYGATFAPGKVGQGFSFKDFRDVGSNTT
jgi:hypothetical protein